MKPQTDTKHTLRLLFWESTIRCNLTCAHCRRVEDNSAAGTDMSTQQAKGLIDQLAQLGRDQDFMPILVFSGGEPLCREDLFELIEYAIRQQLKCALATNGTLIDADIANKVKAAGIERVSVSLDGATAEVHNKLRKLEGSFEDAIHGIRHLQDCRVPYQINMTVTRHNVHQLDDIFELAQQLGAVAVHLFMLVPVGCGEQFPEDEMLSADETETLMKQIAQKEITQELEIKVTCGPHYERIVREQDTPQRRLTKGCLAGSGVLFVCHNGDVFPCGYLPIHCGNVLKETLRSIWSGSTDLTRMADPNQLEGKCGVCGYRAVCGGCRARAFAATGDYMQAEPMCPYKPKNQSRDRHGAGI